MGKRVGDTQHQSSMLSIGIRNVRKRKLNDTAAEISGKGMQLCRTLDDEDSSSNEPVEQSTPRSHQSSKHANNSSILLNSSHNQSGCATDNSGNFPTESPKPVYTLRPSIVNGTIMYDLTQKPWRLGKPIGKGNFGEIFLASDNIRTPVTNENANYVVKIEPHSNGPLFVEIHCLINTAKKIKSECDRKESADFKNISHDISYIQQQAPSGIPEYIASGSHYFGGARYRFLVLQRFDRDLHSLIKNCRVNQKSVLTLAVHIIDVLENLHDRGYCHNDVKAQNLMISKCKYFKEQQTQKMQPKHREAKKSIKYDEHYEERQQTTDSGNSSEQEEAHFGDGEDDGEFVGKRVKYTYAIDDDYEEDFDDGTTSNSANSSNMDIYTTPINKNRGRKTRNNVAVEYSGSNPVRSCRRQKTNTIYDDMVKSHYLRPNKRISYSEFFSEDLFPAKQNSIENGILQISSDDESLEFLPSSVRKSANKKSNGIKKTRITRRQAKLFSKKNTDNAIISTISTPQLKETVINGLLETEEERIFLIDFGLASKFRTNGVHRPFVMDQRRAHDGTLEFTSRDAHMGAHSRRSDLECLGYNLLFWSQGYLPWKESAAQQQQEKVHRAKEYLMTDVREMLKQIYGKQVPKYLGEFLHCVSQLAYHDRPDYNSYRNIFEREFHTLGYSEEIALNSREIQSSSVRVREDIENKHRDILEMHKTKSQVMSIMKNLSVGSPFHEQTLSNRVSPKNLRSKSDKKSIKKKKFSWAEILSQDPDQIARERAEKEFDREEELSEELPQPARRYEGKPTYAILEVLERMKVHGRLSEYLATNLVQKRDPMAVPTNSSQESNEYVIADYEDTQTTESDYEEYDVKGEIDSDKSDDDTENETDYSDFSEQPRTRCAKKSARLKQSNAIQKKCPSRITGYSNERKKYTNSRKKASTSNKKKAGSIKKKASGSATRSDRRVVAASAAGEEQHLQQKQYIGPTDQNSLIKGRRTRRCLHRNRDGANNYGELELNFGNFPTKNTQ